MSTVYLEQQPGDLITAENWNKLQELIRDDIDARAQAAVDGIEQVPRAVDTEKLGGWNADTLIEEVVKRALAQIRAKGQYMKVFKWVSSDEPTFIEHGFGDCPLVDVYVLDYFPVIACQHDERFAAWALFYIHHTSESRFRYEGTDSKKHSLDVVPPGGMSWSVPFSEMLEKYSPEYNEESAFEDVETEFWEAFIAANDKFTTDLCYHSPWFDKHCREERSVKHLKRRGRWDDILFQMRPRKIVIPEEQRKEREIIIQGPKPAAAKKQVVTVERTKLVQIEVAHHDLNTTALQLRSPTSESLKPRKEPKAFPADWQGPDKGLPIMALLKA